MISKKVKKNHDSSNSRVSPSSFGPLIMNHERKERGTTAVMRREAEGRKFFRKSLILKKDRRVCTGGWWQVGAS